MHDEFALEFSKIESLTDLALEGHMQFLVHIRMMQFIVGGVFPSLKHHRLDFKVRNMHLHLQSVKYILINTILLYNFGLLSIF